MLGLLSGISGFSLGNYFDNSKYNTKVIVGAFVGPVGIFVGIFFDNTKYDTKVIYWDFCWAGWDFGWDIIMTIKY